MFMMINFPIQVASFTGERQAINKYKKSLLKAYRSGVQAGLAFGLGFGAFMFLLYCSYAFAVWYGAKMIIDKGSHSELIQDPEGAFCQLLRLQELSKDSEEKNADDQDGPEIIVDSGRHSIKVHLELATVAATHSPFYLVYPLQSTSSRQQLQNPHNSCFSNIAGSGPTSPTSPVGLSGQARNPNVDYSFSCCSDPCFIGNTTLKSRALKRRAHFIKRRARQKASSHQKVSRRRGEAHERQSGVSAASSVSI
ncbi:hypothetical protein HYC85_030344 [Camellia sinensis]|uniref:ABC transmembrane type-1 domain-containing protein n=1 Tax=Camellia sinensis TaxID=4442 RepID=A0A7J7G0G4_CAMSI|nr:hypothetical protein HYC85_030344 [Camellia sinensis]